MAFDQVAKSLIQQSQKTPKDISDSNSKTRELEAAGWGRVEVLREYRDLYDTTEEDSTKRQILDKVATMHGLLSPESAGANMPIIQINIQGDNTKVNAMLCPNFVLGVPGNQGNEAA